MAYRTGLGATGLGTTFFDTHVAVKDFLGKLQQSIGVSDSSEYADISSWKCPDGPSPFDSSRLHNYLAQVSVGLAITGGRSSNVQTIQYSFYIELQLKKPDGVENFRADMEAVYAVAALIQQQIIAGIALPPDTEQISISNGHTNVDISSTGSKMGTCFRTEDNAGYCECVDGFVLDWEGKCVEATKVTVSCERALDISVPPEDGHLQCDAGYEIRVLDAHMTRKDTTTCAAGNIWTNSWKRYQICDSDESVPYVKAKCDGEQSCQYKFYDNAYGEKMKQAKRVCKRTYRYMQIRYACSKLDTTEYDTTEASDICEQCAQNGFTNERVCEYQGLELSVAYNVNDYDECLGKCANDSSCQAFTYYRRDGTINCYLKTGLLHQKCNSGLEFVFSRKCKLAPTCSTEPKCALSTIPYYVPGTYNWNCNQDGGTKSCNVVCADGFDKVGVTTECTNGVWSLTSSPDNLNVSNGGCQTCSGDPNVVHPIPFGGSWECDISHTTRKVCKAKCPSEKILRGSLTCNRDDTVNIKF